MWLKSVLTFAVILAGATMVGGSAANTSPDSPRCFGEVPTIVGTDGDDFLTGTTGKDVIWAGPGDDTVHGERGNDLICGGTGTDLVDGGRNNDRVDGGPGDHDRAYGGLGDDQVTGGPDDEDEAAGHLGIDRVTGGPGNYDYVHGDYGWDRMDGGPGVGDIASFATSPEGVWVSLQAKKARGDGRDRVFRFDSIDGSPAADVLVGNKQSNALNGGAGNDRLIGGRGADLLNGGQGSDRCRGSAERQSCGNEKPPEAPTYVEIIPTPQAGGGLLVKGGSGRDLVDLYYDPDTSTFHLDAVRGLSLGHGCDRSDADVTRAYCELDGPARWLIVALRNGNDRLRVTDSLVGVGQIRINAGAGNDLVRGGPEDDLIESGRGADRIFGGKGEDGLVGGLPGPTVLVGGPEGDLLAAGGGCAGGALIGGGGKDNASFAETAAHPGRLIISLPKGKAWIDAIKDCDPVRIDRTNENIEGSFDNDVLIGDRRDNSLLGQPGRDIFYGGGGNDVINALDKVRDFVIDCGRRSGSTKLAGVALRDKNDPLAPGCKKQKIGKSLPGLHAEH
ncbi:MAG: calcium-binding protein [Solirubrobacterales bacterium]